MSCEDKYYFYIQNIRGSTTNNIKPDGSRQIGYTYDEFGNLTRTDVNTSFLNEVTLIGNVMDKNTGLQYMNARFYNTATGRFLSQDTYTGKSNSHGRICYRNNLF